MDKITLEKGVTFYEGNQSKQGPQQQNINYFMMNDAEVTMNLTNPNQSLRMTKTEYNSLIRKAVPMGKPQLSTTQQPSKQQASFNASTSAKAPQKILDDLGNQDSMNLSNLQNVRRG